MTAAMVEQQHEIGKNDAVSVKIAQVSDKRDWDTFVENHPESSFFHRFGWSDVVQKTYGHQPFYLIAKSSESRICGVLPLILVKSPFFGRSLISTAFTVGGGALVEAESAISVLIEQAISLAEKHNVQYIEVRDGKIQPGWHSKSGTYAGFVKDIHGDEAENLKQIPRKKRADLRKALHAEADGKLECHVQHDVRTFYDLYAQSVHNLGTPVPPLNWFKNIWNEFREDVEISVLESSGRPVCGLLSFYHNNCVLPYYAGACAAARNLHANDFLYWSQMRRSVSRGCTKFDFGRSKVGAGAYDYKTYWGFEPSPLTYQYHLVTAKGVPDINPNNPKFNLITKVWRSLPLPVANILGPVLAGNLS